MARQFSLAVIRVLHRPSPLGYVLHMRIGQEMFAHNLSALRETMPGAAQLIETFEPEKHYVLCPAQKDGQPLSDAWLVWESSGPAAHQPESAKGWSISETPPDAAESESIHWIYGPDSPQELSCNQLKTLQTSDPELWLDFRAGMGYAIWPLFEEINLREAQNPKERRILAFEDRLELWHAALSLRDWSVLIRSERVLFLIGRNLQQITAQFFEKYPEAAIGSKEFFPENDPVQGNTGSKFTIEQFKKELRNYEQRVAQSMENRVKAIRQTRQNHMIRHTQRILFIAPGHNYLQAACVQALVEMTHHAKHALEPAKIHRFTQHGSWLRHIEEFRPDLIVGLNVTPRRFAESSLLERLGCQTAVWYVDNPARFDDSDEDLERTGLVACFDATYLPWLREHGARDPFALHTAAGLMRSGSEGPSRNGPALLFVGELGAEGFETEERYWKRTNPDLLNRCQEVLETFEAGPPRLLQDIYREHGLEELHPFRGIIVNYLENKATYRLRMKYLEPLAEMRPTIFGPSEWGDPARAGKLAGCWAGRRIPYGEELANLYASAGIVLNVFHAQCLQGLNPRVYDVLACGGTLITNENSGLKSEFEAGQELFAAASPEDLARLVASKIEDSGQVRAGNSDVARRGQLKSLVAHRYHARMKVLLSRADGTCGTLGLMGI